MIKVERLRKEYPGVVAVNDISFTIDSPGVYGLLGPNGAGKTTTMRMLTTFLAPTSGSASIMGNDVLTQSLAARKCIGYLPEQNPLYPEMRVEEYLRFRAVLKDVPGKNAGGRVEESLKMAGLTEESDRIVGQLSKGYKKRVGLADAVLADPPILILDEPTEGLDPNQVREFRALLENFGKTKAVLYSTHILSEVELVCKRMVVIHRGNLVADGTNDEIAEKLRLSNKLRVIVVTTNGKELKDKIDAMKGVERVNWYERADEQVYEIETRADIRDEMFSMLKANGAIVREFAHVKPSLEEAFAKLTER